ncbi:MAG: nodulation protein NfeD [Gammaproteobacteria bacterium]|nr:nodulation protein NfeD [Gammaproteobacteria bacterium]
MFIARTAPFTVRVLAAALGGLAITAIAQDGGSPDSGGPERLRTAVLVEISDAISPATREFFEGALERAEETGAELLILQLDTPGGLSDSMRDMIRAILNSPVPVVTFVAPPGAHAASAGTFILYASHVAAMAPGTNLGAASPVPISGPPPRDPGGADKEGEREPRDPATAMDRKALNDAVAYIRSIAEMRGRDVEFAQAAVAEAASITAAEALRRGVIDLMADDLPGLLRALDGREVSLPAGKRALATQDIAVERIEMNWRTALLTVLANPLVAYGLLLIGIYGLLFEGYNPGAILPGVVGGVCLLLGLYALQVLSVNFAGLALILLGVGMMIGEFFVPSFGALGLGGLVAFVFGSIVLMDTDEPGAYLNRGLIGGIAVAAGSAMLGTVWLAVRQRRRRVVTGPESMVGDFAVALSGFAERGRVRIYGESWNAVASRPVRAGQRVRVDRIDGLTLHVTPED